MNSTETTVWDRLRRAMRDGLESLDVPRAAFGDAPPERIAVERGMAWPVLDRSPSSPDVFAWINPLLSVGFDADDTDVTDRLGHCRSAYRGLLWYAVIQTVRVSDRVLIGSEAEAVVRQVDALRTDIESATRPFADAVLPASKGDAVAGLAWNAVALAAAAQLLHDESLARLAARAVRAIASRQQSAGGYLAATSADNPETLWFHELQIAHAVASLGLQMRDERLIASAARAAAWHMNETQPDHATNQPWGLTAFLIDPATHLMADGLIHAAAVDQPGQLSGVSLILLADALYSSRRR